MSDAARALQVVDEKLIMVALYNNTIVAEQCIIIFFTYM